MVHTENYEFPHEPRKFVMKYNRKVKRLQQGFSDSTPKAGSERLQKSAKSALQLIFIGPISTQKYGSGHFNPFKIKFVQ